MPAATGLDRKKTRQESDHGLGDAFSRRPTGGFEYFDSKGIPTFSSKFTRELCEENRENKPQKFFRNDTVFDYGSRRFKAIFPGAGHTKDNIVVWFEREEILYGGCLVKSTESSHLGNIADADLKAWPRTIRKLISECPNPKFVIPGHFNWSGNPLQHTLRLLEN